MGFRVWGLGFEIWNLGSGEVLLGFEVWGLAFRFWGDLACGRVRSTLYSETHPYCRRALGHHTALWGSGCSVCGSGFKGSRLGFRV